MNQRNKYAAEFIGTFCLVLAGIGAIIANDLHGGTVTTVGIGLCFGLIVMAMIYSLGDISGAHINPAVTIAFWIAKRFEGVQVIPHVLVQLAGAIAASLVLRFVFPEHEAIGGTTPAGNCWGWGVY